MEVWRNLVLRLDNKKIFAISLFLGLIFTGICTKNYSIRVQNAIAGEIIRFHVLANSNSDFDQALKLQVRDEILKGLYHKLKSARNRQQTQIILRENLSLIKEIARQTVIKNGYDYDVQAFMAHDDFPTKKYSDIKFPAGNYETLKIIIGRGLGQNWWCVMFPPLCFVDVTRKSLPANFKDELKNILSEDEFKIINSENEKAIPVKVKFKIVEAWQKFFIQHNHNCSNKFQKDVA